MINERISFMKNQLRQIGIMLFLILGLTFPIKTEAQELEKAAGENVWENTQEVSQDFLILASDGMSAGEESDLVSLLMVIGVPCLISGMICMGFVKQMRTAVEQRDADAYVTKQGVNIRVREDRFTHKTERREVIEEKKG